MGSQSRWSPLPGSVSVPQRPLLAAQAQAVCLPRRSLWLTFSFSFRRLVVWLVGWLIFFLVEVGVT